MNLQIIRNTKMALSDKDRAAFLMLQSGHISDAMEGLSLPRTVLHGFTYLGKPGAKLVGTAFTVRQAPKHATAARTDALVSHAKVSGELASAGDIVVIDAGGRIDTGTWGENHCMRAGARDVAGAVINGATRDAHEIRALDFPVFCQGFSPVKSLWDLETVGLKEPVTICSVQIRQGDIVFGDETGIIIVPPEQKDVILEHAKRIHDQEAEYAKQFTS
jgi:regulator of RNase E activity RraA